MGCTKDFTLSAGFTNPSNYWPMASIVGGTTPDTIGGNDLVLGKMSGFPGVFSAGGSEVVVAGGLLTNAISFPSTSYPAAVDCARTTVPVGIGNTNDFSIRIWVKDPSGVSGAGAFDSQVNNVGIQNTHAGSNAVSTDGDVFYMHQPNPPAYVETSIDFSADDPLNTAWHRVILTWTNSTKTMLVKFDNDVSRTTLNTSGSWMDVLYYLSLGINGFAANLCECGLWANHALTESEMTYDWNGGAGRGYP